MRVFVLVGVSLVLAGCSALSSEPVVVHPPAEIPEGWQSYDIGGAGFTFAAPTGWEFDSVKGQQSLGGGLFTPRVSVPDGTFFVFGQKLDEKSVAEGGAGMIMIERKPADMGKSLEELAKEPTSSLGASLMEMMNIKPTVETEILDLPMGEVLRIKESFGNDGASISYVTKRDGKVLKFSFLNLGSADQRPIPSRRIMETLRYK